MNMLSIIKLLIFFIVFIIICESSGLALLKKLNISLNIIALPIGMVLFGCLYELFILPAQFFNLDSALLKCSLVIVSIITLVFGKDELSIIPKYLSKRDLLILFVFVVLFIIRSLDLSVFDVNYSYSDNSYYVPFINGISLDGVAVNGIDSNMYIGAANSAIYAFYGLLHFFGAVSNLLTVDTLLTINFLSWWYFIIFIITNIYNICFVIKKYDLLKNINIYLVIAFLSVGFLRSVGVSDSICVGVSSMMFIVSPLIYYLTDKNKGWLVLFALYSYFSISSRSSFIFQLAVFLLPYYLYLLIKNKFEVRENVYIISPILFSLILYLSYGKNILFLVAGLILLIVLVVFLPLLVDRIGNKTTKYIYFIILCSMFIYFILRSISIGNIVATWDNIRVFELYNNFFFNFTSYEHIVNSLYNLSYLIFGIITLVYSLINKKDISYYSVNNIVIFLLCLNNLVGPFWAKTLSTVAGRLASSWINPLLFLLMLNEFLNIVNSLKLKKILCITLSLFLIINYSVFYIGDYCIYNYDSIKVFNSRKDDISYFYKVGKESCEIGKIIDNYAREKGLRYVQVVCPINKLNCAFVTNKIRISSLLGNRKIVEHFLAKDYFKEMYNEENYQYPILFYLHEPYRFFDDWHIENDYNNIPNIGKTLKDNNVDILVFNKWEDREETCYNLSEYLSSFSDMIYENEQYYICAIR